jgi:hypothetical protein
MTPEASTWFFSLDACRGLLECAVRSEVEGGCPLPEKTESLLYLRRLRDATIFR